MNPYQKAIEDARIAASAAKEAETSAARARLEEIERKLSAAHERLAMESMPEVDMAAESLRAAGIEATVALGRVKEEHMSSAAIILSLRAASSHAHLAEFRLTASHLDSAIVARSIRHGCDETLGQCAEDSDLRNFTRLALLRFITSMPILP